MTRSSARPIARALRRYLAAALLLLGAAQVTAPAASTHNPAETIEQIQFSRTGGFAGPVSKVEARVDFHDGLAEVKADNPRYSRKLDKRETSKLKSIDVSRLSTLNRNNSAGADEFAYNIRLKTADGKNHSVRIGEEPVSELDKLSPGLGRLAEFVRRESERIWQTTQSSRREQH
jgi:hypothetical protein